MIIDSHVHISDRPTPVYRHSPFSAEELLELMDSSYHVNGQKRRVDMALVMPHVGETMEPGVSLVQQHSYIQQSLDKYPDRLLGCIMVNPHRGAELIVKELNQLAKAGFKAVKLHPTVHSYFPPRNRDLLDPIFETAAGLKLPVIIHTGEPPFAIPSLWAPSAHDHPKTSIIFAHMGTQMVSYASEALYVAENNANIFMDTSWASLPVLKRAVACLGPERLLLGSDCPIQEVGTQIRTVEVLGWKPPLGMGLDAASVERILGDNLADLLGIRC
jgi:predicted TIM-barrel fold metal-dependent hydrolase